jgi:hypothetical protein
MGGRRPGWGKRGLHPAGSERREHSPSNSWACEERGVTDTCFVVVRRGLITNHACNARVSAMHAKSMRAAFVVCGAAHSFFMSGILILLSAAPPRNGHSVPREIPHRRWQ